MLTSTGVVFSITIVALSLASTSSPSHWCVGANQPNPIYSLFSFDSRRRTEEPMVCLTHRDKCGLIAGINSVWDELKAASDEAQRSSMVIENGKVSFSFPVNQFSILSKNDNPNVSTATQAGNVRYMNNNAIALRRFRFIPNRINNIIMIVTRVKQAIINAARWNYYMLKIADSMIAATPNSNSPCASDNQLGLKATIHSCCASNYPPNDHKNTLFLDWHGNCVFCPIAITKGNTNRKE